MNTVCRWFELDVKLLHLLHLFLQNVLQWTSCGSSVLCQGFQRIFVSPEPELQQKVIQQEKKCGEAIRRFISTERLQILAALKEKKEMCQISERKMTF